jgi:hypothetical protein
MFGGFQHQLQLGRVSQQPILRWIIPVHRVLMYVYFSVGGMCIGSPGGRWGTGVQTGSKGTCGIVPVLCCVCSICVASLGFIGQFTADIEVLQCAFEPRCQGWVVSCEVPAGQNTRCNFNKALPAAWAVF